MASEPEFVEWYGSDDSANSESIDLPIVPIVPMTVSLHDSYRLPRVSDSVQRAVEEWAKVLAESLQLSQSDLVLAPNDIPVVHCNCLCAYRHKGEWFCWGEMPATLSIDVNYPSVSVTMCPACANVDPSRVPR